MADGASLGVHEARTLLARARTLVDLVGTIENGRATLRGDVEKAFHALREQMVHRELANIPVARLRETTGGRLRIGPLEQAGVTTVLDVYGSPAGQLQQVPGVGLTTATQLVAAARQVATAVRDDLRVRVDLNPSDAASAALISALHTLREFEGAAEQAREPASRLAKDLDTALPVAAATGSRLRRFFSGRERQAGAQAALVRVQELVAWTESSGLAESLKGAATELRGAVDPRAAWEQFERRSPEFYGLLGEVVELGGDEEAAAGFLPADLVEQITSHPLDDAYRRVSLRGYQAFGARFALARRRVIIGDEMGLGKTIQAIAAMTHLRATGAQRFLVACPASVLVNWTREISDRSELPPYRLHGLERAANQRMWERQGGVGVTTLDSLYSLTVPAEVTVDQLIVDEAHFVKNPEARRSQAVRAWTRRVDRVLFLTGTPMENRVEEFRNLVGYLQPTLASAVDVGTASQARQPSGERSPRSISGATRTTCSWSCPTSSAPTTGWSSAVPTISHTGTRSPRATSWRCAGRPTHPERRGLQSSAACLRSSRRARRTVARSWSSPTSAMSSRPSAPHSGGECSGPSPVTCPLRSGRQSSTSSRRPTVTPCCSPRSRPAGPGSTSRRPASSSSASRR